MIGSFEIGRDDRARACYRFSALVDEATRFLPRIPRRSLRGFPTSLLRVEAISVHRATFRVR